jgi:urea transport system substrate-binding protein
MGEWPIVELGRRNRGDPGREAGARLSMTLERGLPQDQYRIGMLIPMSGTAGIWGPSCLACATLATEAWNAAGGFNGREVNLTLVDASDESTTFEADVQQLIDDQAVDALVGMHTSSVRQRVPGLGDDMPFIYTPLYEGGPLPRGVLAIGDTPQRQLLPALIWLTERYRLKRWYLVGNDYCWPRRSHAMAIPALTAAGSTVVGSRYVPLGGCDIDQLIDEIRRSDAQAVLMSLIGQDAIEFSRAFGDSGLADRVLRLSCAIEENGLLAIGPDHTSGLFVSSGYFASLQTETNGAFKERYWGRFGDRAPVLNALGQSTYEGIAFLRGLLERGNRAGPQVEFASVRSTRWRSNAEKTTPIYLAEADGMSLKVIQALQPTAS